MIGLRVIHNGQWLVAVKGNDNGEASRLSVVCSVEPLSVMRFKTEKEARAFLERENLGAYLEPAVLPVVDGWNAA